MLAYSILSSFSFLYEQTTSDNPGDETKQHLAMDLQRLFPPIASSINSSDQQGTSSLSPKPSVVASDSGTKQHRQEQVPSASKLTEAAATPTKDNSGGGAGDETKHLAKDSQRLLPPIASSTNNSDSQGAGSLSPEPLVGASVSGSKQRRQQQQQVTSVSKSTAAAAPAKKGSSLPFLSSCICVMDDNHRLVEWIAYHYYVMNLRYLVILADPKSRVFPQPVLDKWRDKLTIVEWKDTDFMNEKQLSFSAIVHNSTKVTSKILLQKHHNMRQNGFLQECAVHMKEHKRTWVSFTDVDEYYVINHDLVRNSTGRMQEPGAGMRILHDASRHLTALHRMTNITITDRFISPCGKSWST
jgi:hypothetical protein